MIRDAKVAVVMPAYNAEKTLEKTVKEIDRDVVDDLILVDDNSGDRTVELAKRLGLFVHKHDDNRGYGGNQKSCYRLALERGADIVIMVHPDYQYDPKLAPVMAYMVQTGIYDVVLGSRILGDTALAGGMPIVKYVANRFLTAFQNLVMGGKLSEYHTGYRAFSRKVLETLPLEENSDDFIFDNQFLCQCLAFDFSIGEISCPTKYFTDASSINMRRSAIYGLGCMAMSVKLRLHKLGLRTNPMFSSAGKKLNMSNESE